MGADVDDDPEAMGDMGDMVLLVRTRFDGSIVRAWMPAALAIAEVGYNCNNGDIYVSARIIADDVEMGAWDRSA